MATVEQAYQIEEYNYKENYSRKIEVTGDIQGYFGIHYNDKTTLYSVTHIPTGRMLEAFYSKDIAVRFTKLVSDLPDIDFSQSDIRYFLDLPKEKRDLIKHLKDIYNIEDYDNTPDDEEN